MDWIKVPSLARFLALDLRKPGRKKGLSWRHTLVLGSAPRTRVMGLMPSVLGMKRSREVTVVLWRDATCAGVNSSIWPLHWWVLRTRSHLECVFRVCFMCVCVSLPESQLLEPGPDLLSVKPQSILVSHTLCDIEAGPDQTQHIAVQQPGQELS